ncbi:protein hunchback-like [Pseudomyrmex gracilis]|uniref:protein hunchback-like n=1 Tax=Pseudomyrmex gracilis TaxID=219809 RepID=UPI000994D510|nr:protein hunchback-like [Pseudomyrmex gracilis]XP_020293251.1 protein hunchback-like [Pseudomyrmex gracilis]
MSEYQTDQSTDYASNVTSTINGDIKCAQNMSQYPIHTLATSNRFEFTEQLINYYTSERDSTNLKTVLAHLPAFASSQERARSSSVTSGQFTEHSSIEEEINKFKFYVSHNNPHSNTKRKQGKSCKQCSFVANTKLDYWEHMRCHIKGFNCSECSFVTKYKHHMNHHWLSVHDGSKPFKCKKCPYSCVSKSMLTSHLKKHSNIYPYRCANCSYKTKFCNALKKHLRKKVHQPAMVLNADGTPNPLSIIDVYGTKRGPKQKPTPVIKDDDALDHNAGDVTDNKQFNSTINFPILPLQSPVAHYLAMSANSSNKMSHNVVNQNQSVVTCNDLVSAFNLSSHLLLREDDTLRDIRSRNKIDHPQSNAVIHSKATNTGEDKKTSDIFIQNLRVACFDKTDVGKSQISDDTKTASGFSLFMTMEAAKLAAESSHKDHTADIPLDLRVSKLIKTNQLSITNSSNTLSGTSKRKGRAVKLEICSIKENKMSKQNNEEIISESADDQLDLQREKITEAEDTEVVNAIDGELMCYYCEITFGNLVMYTVHMGYHGFDDPYTCNMCGIRYTDKVSFFLHIGRSKHNE